MRKNQKTIQPLIEIWSLNITRNANAVQLSFFREALKKTALFGTIVPKYPEKKRDLL